jgi:RNA-directed DNA polymerase
MDATDPLLRDLFQAYYDARKNKRGTANALRFEMDFETRLFGLYKDLSERTYEVSKSICFIVFEPVRREIFAGDFRDRIVHHLVYNWLSPLCERLFIYDSYGCRTGKGTSCGIRRADRFIRSCSRNYTQDCFVLKMDIKSYFMSMDRSILYEKVRRILERFRNEASFDTDLALWILRKIIFHDHTRHCRIRGDRSDWVGLPRSKSLFYAKPNKGFPIGNLTSQLFGNIYLNDFDRFVVHTLGCRRYARYVDDFLLVHEDNEALKSFVPRIREYLRQELALDPHPKKLYLQHVSKGVDFLGVSLKPNRICPRHRLKGNLYASIGQWNRLIEERGGTLDTGEAEAFLASVNSRLGNLARYRTRRLRRRALGRLSPFFGRYVVFGSPYRKLAGRLSVPQDFEEAFGHGVPT